MHWLTDTERHAWHTYLEASRLAKRQLETDLRPFGLTMNDYEILAHLFGAEDMRLRMSDLASATFQSRSRLSHQITRLENANLVLRQKCESDRRGLYARLTEQGLNTVRKIAPFYAASVRRHFIAFLSPESLTQLHKTLKTIRLGLVGGPLDLLRSAGSER
ncbi:MarR family winged helix-turn-helix transcriptional regulator [Streptomyces sp. CA-251387]|uniref:MarR family winged helix-turn-helix transcriptional regulator n=1 Tax=Streptomyces sp. CA-251387 TaxID=3240064 RepID=UPI003D8F5181